MITNADFKTLYTGGTFDIPHIGHYCFLRQCKELFPNSWLVVSLNTDEFIYEYKGFYPVFNYKERESLLRKIEYVDDVVPNIGGADSTITIAIVNPHVVLIGTDWLAKDYCKQMGFTPKWLVEHNISLCYVPYTIGISSSDIKNRLVNA